jgi:ribonuclease HI
MADSNRSKEFTCKTCGATFTMPQTVIDKYPNWTPAKCKRCHSVKRQKRRTPSSHPIDPTYFEQSKQETNNQLDTFDLPEELDVALRNVLRRYTAGPLSGVFTDGGCSGNPGPGGWGAVYVQDDQVLDMRYGRETNTTNNRMELMALHAAFEMITSDKEVVIWSDSQLCVNTFTQWAPKWKENGWRRKGGEIKNLDLIQPLYKIIQDHPRAQLRWLKAHNGSRWNEYVDTLAATRLREDKK